MTATPTKKRILFVDDEPSILAGLQNLLYKDRRRWEMAFASTGDEALTKVRAQHFDVVVSDMRMPGMDGATLLNRVKEASPATARIMLSGHAEREAIVRALPALHQLLAKPCDAITLRAAIENSLETEAALRTVAVRAIVGKIDKLPSPPTVCRELEAAISCPTTMLEDVARIVVKDPGLAAKVLQLVNSAYFGSGAKTSSISEAIALLGTEQLRFIGVTASVFGAVVDDPFPEFSLREHQEHAIRTAMAVKRIARGALVEEAFAGALLHDVGSVVLALGFPEAYRAVLAESHATSRDITELELAAFGVTHAEVGASLLNLWGIPGAILDIVRHHHDPGSAPERTQSIAAAVYCAEAWTDREPREVDLAVLERAGCASQASLWRRVVDGEDS